MYTRLQEFKDYLFGDIANIKLQQQELALREQARLKLFDVRKSNKELKMAQKRAPKVPKDSRDAKDIKTEPRKIKTIEEKQQLLAKDITAKCKSYFDNLIEEKDKTKFRQALRTLKAKTHVEELYFGNTTDNLPDQKEYNPEYADSLNNNCKDETIIKQFEALDSKFHFFEEKDEKIAPTFKKYIYAKFIDIYKVLKLVGDFIEKSTEEDIINQAYKLLVIFGDIKNFDDYLVKNPALLREERPIHDALTWSLPINSQSKPIDLIKWQQLIMSTQGVKSFRLLFSRAVEIEAALKRAPETFAEGFAIAKTVSYKDADKDPLLAELCMEHGVNQGVFNTCLELNKIRKKTDNLPDIKINGKTVGKPEYHLVKLPIDDPRAYLLGHITNCCQSIGGHSQMCVSDGVTRQNNGFYVLLKEKNVDKNSDVKAESKDSPLIEGKIDYENFDIVGQGYAWISEEANLVFDSWENLRPAFKVEEKDNVTTNLRDDAVIVPMLTEFARIAAEKAKMVRVMIGTGGKTPQAFKSKPSLIPESILEGHQYGDSSEQAIIYANEKLQNELIMQLQKSFCVHFSDEKLAMEMSKYLFPKNNIISARQVQQLDSLLNAILKNEEMKKYIVTILHSSIEYKAEMENHPFIKAATHDLKLWKLLQVLQELNQLNPDNVNAVIRICLSELKTKNVEYILNSFQLLLNSSTIFDTDRFKTSYEYRIAATCSDAFKTIDKLQEKLHSILPASDLEAKDQFINLIFNKNFVISLPNAIQIQSLLNNDEMKNYIQTFYTAKINNVEFKESNLEDAIEHSDSLAWIAFAQLNDAKMLNKNNINEIISVFSTNHNNKIAAITNSLVILQKADLLNQQLYEFVIKNDNHLAFPLSRAITELGKAGLFNKEMNMHNDMNIKILLSDPRHAEEIAMGLADLHGKGYLTSDTQKLIGDDIANIKMKNIIIQLQEAKLFNETNFNSLKQFVLDYETYIDYDELKKQPTLSRQQPNIEDILDEMNSKLSNNQLLIIQAWIFLHKNDLITDKNMENIIRFFKIKPELINTTLAKIQNLSDPLAIQKFLDGLVSPSLKPFSHFKSVIKEELKQDIKDTKDVKDIKGSHIP